MSKKYIRILTKEQGDKFLEITRNDGRYKAYKYGTLDFEMIEHHPGYSGCHIDFNDFYFHVHFGGFEASSGYHDYTKEFRLFMMQQKNIDTAQYVKDLLEFLENEKNEKIETIKQKAKEQIAETKQETEKDIAYYENMLQLIQNNPDIDINLKN